MRRARFSDARGTVLIEILIAFMPLFVLFLGVVQYALLAGAQLVVQHAAVAGVRAASVVLDDDPAHYDDQERLEIGGQDSPRMIAIRSAVHARLAAIVPARAMSSLRPTDSQSLSVAAALASPNQRLLQAPAYLPIATAVTFPREPGGDSLFTHRVDPVGALTVRVTHLALCEVPIAAQIMCPLLADMRAGPSNARFSELAQAPDAAFQALWLGTSARMVVLQAEATMPLQTATYRYASELPEAGDET